LHRKKASIASGHHFCLPVFKKQIYDTIVLDQQTTFTRFLVMTNGTSFNPQVIDQSIRHQVIVNIETRDNRFHISRWRRGNIVARTSENLVDLARATIALCLLTNTLKELTIVVVGHDIMIQ
jgi:hypothetical protein